MAFNNLPPSRVPLPHPARPIPLLHPLGWAAISPNHAGHHRHCWFILTIIINFTFIIAPSISSTQSNLWWAWGGWRNKSSNAFSKWVILVNMEISVILGHEKTKIHNIIDYGKIDVFSVRTIIHIKNKMMGHLIWPFGVLLYKTFQKWDVPRWRKAGWMIVLTCQTHFFCNTGTILAQ